MKILLMNRTLLTTALTLMILGIAFAAPADYKISMGSEIGTISKLCS